MRGFKEILEGQHDDLPERAFYMKGGIDEVTEGMRKETRTRRKSARRPRRPTKENGELVAHTKFKCQVLTPEGEAFNDEVEMVSTRTGVGSLGILANHAPLMGMLEPTELRLYKTESDIVRFAQSEGYLQVVDNECLLLVEEAVEPDKLDRSDLEEKLRRASRRPSAPRKARGAGAPRA